MLDDDDEADALRPREPIGSSGLRLLPVNRGADDDEDEGSEGKELAAVLPVLRETPDSPFSPSCLPRLLGAEDDDDELGKESDAVRLRALIGNSGLRFLSVSREGVDEDEDEDEGAGNGAKDVVLFFRVPPEARLLVARLEDNADEEDDERDEDEEDDDDDELDEEDDDELDDEDKSGNAPFARKDRTSVARCR